MTGLAVHDDCNRILTHLCFTDPLGHTNQVLKLYAWRSRSPGNKALKMTDFFPMTLFTSSIQGHLTFGYGTGNGHRTPASLQGVKGRGESKLNSVGE